MHTGYSSELMGFRTYAASLGPTPGPEYEVLHDSICVPVGHLPIKVVQFSQGNSSAVENKFYHWAIFIPTSTRRGVGNFYEIVGNLQRGYGMQRVVNGRHPRWDKDEKGSHLVGWVAPTYLATLEKHFVEIPIAQGRPGWNDRNWVVDALRGVRQEHMYAVQMGTTSGHGRWRLSKRHGMLGTPEQEIRIHASSRNCNCFVLVD